MTGWVRWSRLATLGFARLILVSRLLSDGTRDPDGPASPACCPARLATPLAVSLSLLSAGLGLNEGRLIEGILSSLRRESWKVSRTALNREFTCSDTLSHFEVSSRDSILDNPLLRYKELSEMDRRRGGFVEYAFTLVLEAFPSPACSKFSGWGGDWDLLGENMCSGTAVLGLVARVVLEPAPSSFSILVKLKFAKLGLFGRGNDGSSATSFRTLSVKVDGPDEALRLKFVNPSTRSTLAEEDR